MDVKWCPSSATWGPKGPRNRGKRNKKGPGPKTQPAEKKKRDIRKQRCPGRGKGEIKLWGRWFH